MEFLGKWSINNRVTVNLIMIFIIVAGLITVMNMRREMFPQFSLDIINVSVVYPGASPEEIEEGICVKIEESIIGIEGIDRIFSTAYEGRGSVLVELDSDADTQKVIDDIKTEVDIIDSFPEDAEEPVVIEILNRNPAITVAVYGDVSEKFLHKEAEKIRDDIVDTESISLTNLVGVRDYEIAIEISEENLRQYGISFDDVVKAVKTGSIDLPGGSIKTSHGEILVRSKGQLYTGHEFEGIPLITLNDGTLVRLGQVANIIDGFEDIDMKARFNGRPAALIQVNRTNTEDVIKVTRCVKDYVEKQKAKMPEGMDIATWFDLSTMVQDRINMLLRNGAQGIVLVFIALALFLNLRLAFWVSIGIPISFMGAFLVLDFSGETINMISLFAFIMTLGILVDDAIIIGENIFTHFHKGKSASAAVVDGLKEVGWPVVMAVSTTIVAFIPLLFIAGIMGKFIAVMPRAVIAILIISLGEALIILPAHLSGALTRSALKTDSSPSWHERIRVKVEHLLNIVIKKYYTPALKYVVKNRYFTFAIGVGVLIISLGIVAGGYVPFVFFPKGESNWVIAEVGYPLGTPYEITEKTIEHLEQQVFKLNDLFNKKLKNNKDIIVNTFALVGMIPRRDWKLGESGGHCGEVWIELVPSEKRHDLSVNTVLNKWRSLTGEIPGVETLTFTTLEGGPGGNPIEIQLAGKDFNQLRRAADELKIEMRTYPGTFDITDNFKPGKEEKQVKIKEGARSLGITMSDIARQLRQAFYGEEAVRIQRGRDDIKVMVRYDASDRRSIAGIEEMRIRTIDGQEIPIEEVADITHGRAYSVIHRVDRKRVITVSSNLDESIANASKIVADLNKDFLPKLIERYPGLEYDLEGQEKRTRESLGSLKNGYVLALMVIFLLLASQFRSYIQPVIIMIAIPFGLIGAIAGHLVMGLSITMISIFGIVALSGIVVNDSLILIDFINRAARNNMEIETAVVQSGKVRFRPVLLTSITTIAGLLPLLMERSFQAQFLIPMAVSISFGLLVATVLTLLYVPALYLIVMDVRNIFKGLSTKNPTPTHNP
ncbi:MAG: efflux RND transporter permease subunit [Thermodesulfobacteriota bacterium]|nr:efflux RND transporter permease subunit [Thermodesulfobacteriota bacterium]